MTKLEALTVVLNHLNRVWSPPQVRDAMEVLRKEQQSEKNKEEVGNETV